MGDNKIIFEKEVAETLGIEAAIILELYKAKVQLEKFRDTGINLPIIQFNPIGNPIESFSLLKKTLLDAFWMC